MKTIPPDDTTEFTVLNLNILFCSQFRCKFENCRWQSKNSKTQFYFTIIVISGWKPQLLHGTLHNQINLNQIKNIAFLHMLLLKIAKVVIQLQSSVVFLISGTRSH